MAPRVSVVMPTYKRPPLLLRNLQALAVQTLPRADFELLVVDDGHDEATRLAVEAFAALHPDLALQYRRPARGRGPAVARNEGWRAASAPLVAFTDDDTIPAPDWLAEGLAAMDDRLDWCAAAGRVVVPLPPRRPTDHERMTQGLEAAEFVTANAFVRTVALHAIDGFDERFGRAWREDSDLQFRLEAACGPVGRIEAAQVLHPAREEPWGISLRQQRNAFFDALLFKKHPRLYRQRVRRVPPWDYYAIVGASVAAPALALAGSAGGAVTAAAVALALVARLAWRRLRHTRRTPAHVWEMVATSALIPFLATWWKLRGAWRFRVFFL